MAGETGVDFTPSVPHVAESWSNKGCRCQWKQDWGKYMPSNGLVNSINGAPGFTMEDVGNELDCCALCQVQPWLKSC